VKRIIGVEKMKESKLYREIMQEGELVAKRADLLNTTALRGLSSR
jgi:hypothetical protein